MTPLDKISRKLIQYSENKKDDIKSQSEEGIGDIEMKLQDEIASEYLGDEFTKYQSKKNTLLRGAILYTMRTKMDWISPEKEMELLLQKKLVTIKTNGIKLLPYEWEYLRKPYRRNLLSNNQAAIAIPNEFIYHSKPFIKVIKEYWNWKQSFKNWFQLKIFSLYHIGDAIHAADLIHHSQFYHQNLLLFKINQSRIMSNKISNQIKFIQNYSSHTLHLPDHVIHHQIDSLLCKHFIKYYFMGYRRQILSNLWFHNEYNQETWSSSSRGEDDLFWKNLFRQILRGYVVLICILIIILMTVMWNDLISSNQIGLLYIILPFLLNILIDIVWIQSCKIYGLYVFIPNLMFYDFHALHLILSLRCHTILSRNHQIFRNIHSLLQHFNPICRVARQYPSYSISRWLFSLSDYDIPHHLMFRWSKKIQSYYALPPPPQTTATSHLGRIYEIVFKTKSHVYFDNPQDSNYREFQFIHFSPSSPLISDGLFTIQYNLMIICTIILSYISFFLLSMSQLMLHMFLRIPHFVQISCIEIISSVIIYLLLYQIFQSNPSTLTFIMSLVILILFTLVIPFYLISSRMGWKARFQIWFNDVFCIPVSRRRFLGRKKSNKTKSKLVQYFEYYLKHKSKEIIVPIIMKESPTPGLSKSVMKELSMIHTDRSEQMNEILVDNQLEDMKMNQSNKLKSIPKSRMRELSKISSEKGNEKKGKIEGTNQVKGIEEVKKLETKVNNWNDFSYPVTTGVMNQSPGYQPLRKSIRRNTVMERGPNQQEKVKKSNEFSNKRRVSKDQSVTQSEYDAEEDDDTIIDGPGYRKDLYQIEMKENQMKRRENRIGSIRHAPLVVPQTMAHSDITAIQHQLDYYYLKS